MSAMLLAVGFTAAAQAPASLKDTYKKAFVIGAAVNAAQIQGEINERAVNAGLFRCKLGKIKQLIFMAERLGFEPRLEFPLNTLSKRAPSATRPSLRSAALTV